MNMFDQIFFEKRWTVFMSQGLYASKEYMGSMYKLPTDPRELSMHSIIGYGDSFNEELYRSINWHLSKSYKLSFLDPSVMVSSQSVLMNAVEFGLGIGPLRNYCNQMIYQQLVRVLPDLNGPMVALDFGIRKMVPDEFKQLVEDIESLMLDIVRRMGLKVTVVDTPS
jgi:DNA-binding transcriptional LysR family regulator